MGEPSHRHHFLACTSRPHQPITAAMSSPMSSSMSPPSARQSSHPINPGRQPFTLPSQSPTHLRQPTRQPLMPTCQPLRRSINQSPTLQPITHSPSRRDHQTRHLDQPTAAQSHNAGPHAAVIPVPRQLTPSFIHPPPPSTCPPTNQDSLPTHSRAHAVDIPSARLCCT